VVLVLRALGNPAAEDFFLRGSERRTRLRRRHVLFRVVGRDAIDQFARLGIARHDGLLGDGDLALVEAELGFALAGVRAVAGEAVIGEDGADVAVEFDAGGGVILRRAAHRQRRYRTQRQEQDGGCPEHEGGRYWLCFAEPIWTRLAELRVDFIPRFVTGTSDDKGQRSRWPSTRE